ncbi:hypothetical protein PDL71_06585 [Lacibacter sp. MH-610]|uniref:HYC_CC_PP family protein n=1 Tax=Lacibacter sp. MH-610 TaxID=3020883 RepID=UPI0038922797
MLKKLLIAFIAMFYLAVSSGMAVNIHYCMGKISSVTFGYENDDNDETCGKCGMNQSESHCCNDEIQFIKLTDVQQGFKESASMAPFTFSSPVTIISLQQSLQGCSKELQNTYFEPPPLVLNKVYRAVNVFRI